VHRIRLASTIKKIAKQTLLVTMSSSNPPRPQPRYYLPTAASPSLPSRSRRQSTTTGNVSLPSSPIRRSPGSLAALRSALQSYHVPDPAEPRTPQRGPRYGASKSSLNLQPEDEGAGSAFRPEMMDALVAIHRVLYRGRQDLEYEGRSLGWVEKGKEVRRVVERWFEGDCGRSTRASSDSSLTRSVVYDHPLVRVSSRQSLLAHLILLHLMSSLYLPSLTPAALIHHARGLTSHLRNWLIGVDDEEPGKEKEAEEEWLGVETGKHEREEDDVNDGSWWRVWDVGADCKEIGAMECYGTSHTHNRYRQLIDERM